MKHAIEKRFSRTILAASIASIGFSVPLAVQAEGDDLRSLVTPDSNVEIGVGHISDGSYKFGDYGRGLEDSGAYLIGNIQMNKRGDNNASYLEIIGRNLGLSGSRDFTIKGGEQGNYGLSFEYGELSKLHSDTYQTPYDGAGSTRLTQPAGITDGATTAAIAGLAANMKRFNVETERKAAAFGLTKQLVGGWDVAVNYKHEEKEGTKLTGIPIQIGTGGSRGTALAPEPIDYKTELFDAVARYADEKLQAQVGYHVSLFNNANRSLTWDNLFTGTGNTTGSHGQMPDNQFHQVSAAGGYTFSKATRLSGNLSFGRMTQSEAFLPYSTGGTMPATLSLNGKINNTHMDIKLNSKLTHNLALTTGYKYDDRDNRTPINTYAYITADRDAGGVGTSNTRRNTPLSKTQQMFFADIDYELTKATKLKLGYDFDKIKHTFEPTAGDKEHTVKAEVKHSFSETASGGVAYAHSDRNADPYNGAAPLFSTYSSAYLNSLCVAPNTYVNPITGAVETCTGVASATSQATIPFLDTPALRKYFLADRKRDRLRAYANISPSEKLDLQFGASYYKEKYPDTEAGFGLDEATGWTANFDANLMATDTVSGLFFASFEDYSTEQNGHNGASNAGAGITTLDRQNNTAAFDPLTGMTTRTDRSMTLGLGLRVKPGGRYEWGGDFTHANTKGSTGFSNIGNLLTTIRPVPDAVSRLNRLELFGKYKVQKDLLLNVKYAYEDYNSTDWAWDGQGFTSSTSFIGSGITSPDYTVHAIGASLTYSFK